MMLIAKIERALAFAKELGLNDQQTKELMAMILELSYFKLLESAPIVQPMPWTLPLSPTYPQWDPNQPFRIGDIVSTGKDYQVYHGVTMQPQVHGTLEDFVAGRATSCDLPVGEIITGTFRVPGSNCACSPVGQPHSDSCKSADSLFEQHKHFDH